jgi:branched-chain amino acid transport system permease protein
MNLGRTGMWRAGGVVLLLAIAYAIPFNTPDTELRTMVTVMTFALPALGLALLTGFSGQISIGHGAFMAIGAYSTALLVGEGAVPWFLSVLLAVVISGIAGALVGLPALRIRGTALALATLGLAVLVPQVIRRFSDVTGGSQGYRLFKYRFRSPWESLTDEQWIYLVAVTFVVMALVLAHNLVKSRVGRALVTIRDNEVAAEVAGVNIAAYKILVFGVSAALAGLGGALAVVAQPSVAPGDYGIQLSIRLLVMAVVGGIATVSGPVIGAAAIYYLDDWIRTSDALSDLLDGRSPELAPVVFATILIVLMVVAPDGLVGAGGRLRRRIGRSRGGGGDPGPTREPTESRLSSGTTMVADPETA